MTTAATADSQESKPSLDIQAELRQQRLRLGGWAIYDAANKLKQLQPHQEAIKNVLLLSDAEKTFKALGAFNFYNDQGGLHFPSSAGQLLLDRLWPAVECVPLHELKTGSAAKTANKMLLRTLDEDAAFAATLFPSPLSITCAVVLVRSVATKLLTSRTKEAIVNVKRQKSAATNFALIPSLKAAHTSAKSGDVKPKSSNAGKQRPGDTPGSTPPRIDRVTDCVEQL